MRVAWLVVIATACNRVYGIDETALVDAADTDRDDDGVEDTVDNCANLFNPSQADEDEDGVGDLCDDCPLHANTSQADADGDSIGDVCDPHPATRGDCLLLFDSFIDRSTFATTWDVMTASGGMVTPSDGVVSLVTGPDSGKAQIVARGISGADDVQTIGSATVYDFGGAVGAVARVARLDQGYSCSVAGAGPGVPAAAYAAIAEPTATSIGASVPMSSRSFGTRVAIWLHTLDVSGIRHVRCRVDYGVALGVSSISPPSPITEPSGAGGGIAVFAGTFEAAGIAIYHFDPAAGACAPAVLR